MKNFHNNLSIIIERKKLDEQEGLEYFRNVARLLKPILVILDPLYTLHGLDENRSQDMAPFLNNIRELSIKENLATLLVHHQGKKSEMSSARQSGHQARGSSSLSDVPDGLWSLERKSRQETTSLSFELRNHENPGCLELKLENNWWECIGETTRDSDPAKLPPSEIKKIVEKHKKIRKKEFYEAVKHFGLSDRTVDSRVKNAIRQNLIGSEKVGREIYYFAIEPPQTRRSL